MACCEDVKDLLNMVLAAIGAIDGRLKALEAKMDLALPDLNKQNARIERLERVLAQILVFENETDPPERWLFDELSSKKNIWLGVVQACERGLKLGGSDVREVFLQSLGDALGRYTLGIVEETFRNIPHDPTIIFTPDTLPESFPIGLAPPISLGEAPDLITPIATAITGLVGGANENTGGADKFFEGQALTGKFSADITRLYSFIYLEKVQQTVTDYLIRHLREEFEEKDPKWKEFRKPHIGDATMPTLNETDLIEILTSSLITEEPTEEET